MKQLRWIVLFSFSLAVLPVSLAFAQEPRPTPTNAPDPSSSNSAEANGSIRGTAYWDQDGDGQCVDTDEPVLAGVPVEFVSNDGEFTTFLATGDDGTYGLVAAAYGTWTVSARPNADDFIVTSAASQSVFLGSEEPVVLNVDFCIQEAGGPITAGSEIATFSSTSETTFLPASGSPANNTPYYIALVMGLLLVFVGGAVQLRSHRDKKQA